ncbi:MAG TPA: oligoendopeptidase F [Kiritimatiellia bacterium]|nr:oligoendopeptidase F [Kiritimatiellia bacterium]HPJ56629.1 oligoendopeptidase F [Kiritimatiellia bacterium]HPR68634.1 oligoendopeptidase F [Kiritimatiellia bacterium]HRX06339.1 oligoendopeptidase F [Kiritimatiellia bacterium]
MNSSPKPIPVRREVPEALTWDLSPLYAAAEAWEADFARLDEAAAPVLAMQGKLDSAEAVARLMAAETELDRLLERLHTYAHLRHDEDTADAAGQAREARIRARYAELAAACAWITPELLSHPEEELRAWMEDPRLADCRRTLLKVLRNKPHVLSAPEETLLARGAEVLSASEQTYSLLTNADLAFPDIPGPGGESLPLTEGTYRTYLEHPDRDVRRAAFETLLTTYGKWKNTLASTLSSTVKAHAYMADVRHFPSALEAALFDDQVPVAVYDGLIGATRAALPLFHRYLALRKRALGLADLDMYDLYVPLVPSCAVDVPMEEARDRVREACRPLGEEYGAALETAFTARWIDWRENKGKRSGAYSSGCYDSPPYLLLNHHDRLDDAFTLAHELGHSLHTWLANRAQPHRMAHYPIFLAEIASTVNELLLIHHLLGRNPAPALRAHLLNHLCDSFKGTVFRQTMFAEFERDLHRWEEEGTPLTAEFLCEKYYDLNQTYYGSGLAAHAAIACEWARIPHFYYDFYVYKYATSFCAALVFARRLRAGEGVEAYLGLLRSGGSRDPLEAVAAAGVDLRDAGVLREAFAEFGGVLGELEAALAAPEA